MAYFRPVKDYQLHVLNKCLKNKDIKSPVLEIGCGTGDFLLYLQSHGFRGKGIDLSAEAIEEANKLPLTDFIIEKKDLFDEEGKYNCIMMIDVVEHIEHDQDALTHALSLLNPGGTLIFLVPSHSRKYCWIDSQYGHFRRYDKKDLVKLVESAGFQLDDIWCIGFPFISIMENIVSFIGSRVLGKSNKQTNMAERTDTSGIVSPIQKEMAWTNFLFNKLLGSPILWALPFRIMDWFIHSEMGFIYLTVCKKEKEV